MMQASERNESSHRSPSSSQFTLRRIPRARLNLLLVALCAWIGDGCSPSTNTSLRLERPVAAVPGVPAEVSDHIDDVDFLVDSTGAVHVVWVRQGDFEVSYGYRRSELWYARGDGLGAAWSTPRRLIDSLGGPCHICVASQRLHVLCGAHLRHLVSSDRGASWVEETPLLPEPGPRAESMDMKVAHDTILVTYTVYDVARRENVVWVSATPGSAQIVGRLPGNPDPLALIVLPNGVAVAVATNTWPSGDPERGNSGKTRLEIYSSVGLAGPWTKPQPVPPPQAFNPAAQASWPYICSISSPTSPSRPLLLCDAFGAYVVSWSGVAWRSGKKLPQVERDEQQQTRPSSSIALSDSAPSIMAWIDTRHRRRIPIWFHVIFMSAQPDWPNTDVYASWGPAEQWHAQPIRLTPDLSYASAVRCQVQGSSAVVVWSGLSQVRTPVGAFGSPSGPMMPSSPPQVFFAVLKLSPNGSRVGGAGP